MKRIYGKILLLITILFAAFQSSAFPGNNMKPTSDEMTIRLQAAQLIFTENRGQVKDDKGNACPDILFTAHNGSTQVYLTANSISYQFTKITYPDGYSCIGIDNLRRTVLENSAKKSHCKFVVSLVGANLHPDVFKEGKSNYFENFFLNGDTVGITNVHTYNRVVYKNVYPNIDWVVYSNGNYLKYNFLVHPGGDARKIRLEIKDANRVTISSDGELVMKTDLGVVTEKAPESFAENKLVKSAFRKNIDGTIGFEIDEVKNKELCIDPSVIWASYYGNIKLDYFTACALDDSGNIYAAGNTQSSIGIASSGGYQTTFNGATGSSTDAFLVKFDASGNRLWATYSSNAGNNTINNCATDAFGNVYLAGFTLWSIYGELALLKFNSSGIFKWQVYESGSLSVSPAQAACCTDASGNVFLIGTTNADNYIATPGAYKQYSDWQSTDAFICKFDSTGNKLWGTYYGGDPIPLNNYMDFALSTDVGSSCICDTAGNIYLAGYTNSREGIATPGAYESSLPYYNGTLFAPLLAFLVKFSGTGNLLWGTYIGGWQAAMGSNSLALDAAGNVYVCGNTNMGGFTTSGSYQSTINGGTDAFLASLTPAGALRWFTYYGGTGNEDACVFTDKKSGVYLAGVTTSGSGLIPSGAYQSTYGGNGDGFIAKFDTSGAFLWSTYYGGNNSDQIYCGAADTIGAVYVVGSTASTTGIATVMSYQDTLAGNTDGFIVKFSTSCDLVTGKLISNSTNQTGNIFCPGDTIRIPFAPSMSSCVVPTSTTFTAQLSDSTGSFASPINIGTASSLYSDTIAGTIPMNTSHGNKYRIRVISSMPGNESTDNGSNVTINGAVDTPVFNMGTSSVRCSGADTIIYSATALYSSEMIYALDSASLLGGNSINATTGLVTYAPGWSGQSVITTMASGCDGSTATAAHIVTINPLPLTPGAFTIASDSVCLNQSDILYVIPVDTFTHTWHYTGTGATISGTGDSVHISFSNTATSGMVQVTSTNNCGTSAPRTLNVTVLAHPVLSVTGSDSICNGGSVVLHATGAVSYLWAPTSMLSVSAGDSVTASPTSTTTYSIIGTSHGCSDTITKTLVVNPLPDDSIMATPPYSMCLGSLFPMHVVSDSSYRYQWMLNGAILNDTTSSFSASDSGMYTVRITNSYGCVATSVPIHVTLLPTPAPVILVTGNQLCTSQPYASYQWYFNGNLIPGDTTQCIIATTLGAYKVVVINDSGCSGTVTYHPIGYVTGINASTSIQLYPNPTTGLVYIKCSDPVNVAVGTIDGRKLLQADNTKQIDISALPDAIYLIKVYDKNNTLLKVEKLVKTTW